MTLTFSAAFILAGFPPCREWAGVHYDGKFDNDDKQSVAYAKYKIESLDLTNGLTTAVIRPKAITPGAILDGGSAQTYDNSMLRQKLSLVCHTTRRKLDSTSNLKISVDGTLKT